MNKIASWNVYIKKSLRILASVAVVTISIFGMTHNLQMSVANETNAPLTSPVTSPVTPTPTESPTGTPVPPSVTPTPTEPPEIIETYFEVNLNVEPDRNTNFRFFPSANLSKRSFVLDDTGSYDDGDLYYSTRIIQVQPLTTYSLKLEIAPASSWYIQDIVCGEGIMITEAPDKNNYYSKTVGFQVAEGMHSGCEFKVSLKSSISVLSFNDINGNGVLNKNEPRNRGRTFSLYQKSTGSLLKTLTTNANGATSSGRIIYKPDTYIMCETLPSGWISTSPSDKHPIYNQPCSEVYMDAAGETASMRFASKLAPTPPVPPVVKAQLIHYLEGVMPYEADPDNYVVVRLGFNVLNESNVPVRIEVNNLMTGWTWYSSILKPEVINTYVEAPLSKNEEFIQFNGCLIYQADPYGRCNYVNGSNDTLAPFNAQGDRAYGFIDVKVKRYTQDVMAQNLISIIISNQDAKLQEYKQQIIPFIIPKR